MEHSGGFAISTYDESHIEDNAEERFGLRYGDAADRADMMSLGLVDAKGKAYSSWSGSKWVKASSRTAALKAAKSFVRK